MNHNNTANDAENAPSQKKNEPQVVFKLMHATIQNTFAAALPTGSASGPISGTIVTEYLEHPADFVQ